MFFFPLKCQYFHSLPYTKWKATRRLKENHMQTCISRELS